MNQGKGKAWAGSTKTLFQIGGEKQKLLIYDHRTANDAVKSLTGQIWHNTSCEKIKEKERPFCALT